MKLLCWILGLSIISCKSDAIEIRHVYLTWQGDPCTNVTINVHGIKTPAVLTVYYDEVPHASKVSDYSYKKSVQAVKKRGLPEDRSLYHFELLGLKEGTTYYFAIGDNRHSYGKESAFRTLPKTGSLLFVEGGDWENTEEAKMLAKEAAKLNPHAVLLGGDYPSNVRSVKDYKKWDVWLDVYEKCMVTDQGHLIPVVMAMGNHEVVKPLSKKKEDAPFYYDYFPQGNTKKSYFSLSLRDNVHLFILDSGHNYPHRGEQSLWLTQELEKYQNVPIKIALYHVPLFPSVRFAQKDIWHDWMHKLIERWKGKQMASQLFSKESEEGRLAWMPLFDQYHLTTAFENHDQALKRTKLLKKGRLDSRGTLYLGDGNWGAKVQFFATQGIFYPFFEKVRGKVHFFWTMEIGEKKIVYKAISKKGQILDQFTQRI